jgi:hypothetical protein
LDQFGAHVVTPSRVDEEDLFLDQHNLPIRIYRTSYADDDIVEKKGETE